jgi:predicted secreted Zn-dependent protease
MRMYQAQFLPSRIASTAIIILKRSFYNKALRLITGLGLAFFLTFLPILRAHANSTAASIAPTLAAVRPTEKAATSPALAVANTQAAPSSPNSASNNSTVYIPQCTPDTSYTLPSSISPTGSGLSIQVDQPSIYTVYGDSTTAIINQMADCTPVTSSGTGGSPGKYGASTANAVSWSVSYSEAGDTCSITSVGVTIHINQVFPSWSAPSDASTSLTAAWQAYIAKLHAYEQGHVNLDELWAKNVLNDISAIQPGNCDSIDQTVNATARNDLSNSLAANSNYDQVNDFGNKEDVNL